MSFTTETGTNDSLKATKDFILNTNGKLEKHINVNVATTVTILDNVTKSISTPNTLHLIDDETFINREI